MIYVSRLTFFHHSPQVSNQRLAKEFASFKKSNEDQAFNVGKAIDQKIEQVIPSRIDQVVDSKLADSIRSYKQDIESTFKDQKELHGEEFGKIVKDVTTDLVKKTLDKVVPSSPVPSPEPVPVPQVPSGLLAGSPKVSPLSSTSTIPVNSPSPATTMDCSSPASSQGSSDQTEAADFLKRMRNTSGAGLMPSSSGLEFRHLDKSQDSPSSKRLKISQQQSCLGCDPFGDRHSDTTKLTNCPKQSDSSPPRGAEKNLGNQFDWSDLFSNYKGIPTNHPLFNKDVFKPLFNPNSSPDRLGSPLFSKPPQMELTAVPDRSMFQVVSDKGTLIKFANSWDLNSRVAFLKLLHVQNPTGAAEFQFNLLESESSTVARSKKMSLATFDIQTGAQTGFEDFVTQQVQNLTDSLSEQSCKRSTDDASPLELKRFRNLITSKQFHKVQSHSSFLDDFKMGIKQFLHCASVQVWTEYPCAVISHSVRDDLFSLIDFATSKRVPAQVIEQILCRGLKKHEVDLVRLVDPSNGSSSYAQRVHSVFNKKAPGASRSKFAIWFDDQLVAETEADGVKFQLQKAQLEFQSVLQSQMDELRSSINKKGKGKREKNVPNKPRKVPDDSPNPARSGQTTSAGWYSASGVFTKFRQFCFDSWLGKCSGDPCSRASKPRKGKGRASPLLHEVPASAAEFNATKSSKAGKKVLSELTYEQCLSNCKH